MRVFTNLEHKFNFKNAVITIGSFDGVHEGHQKILRQVNQLAHECQGESVVITFDPHPRTILQPQDDSFRLLTNTAEKITLLEEDAVQNVVIVPFSLDFARQSARAYVEDFLIEKFHPRYIVIGYDHRFGAGREGDIDFLKQYEKTAGFDIVEIAAQEIDAMTISSSKIRTALEQADMQLANRLLGRPFFLEGTVVRGNQIGRSIGFPTANLRLPDPRKRMPPDGIYAAKVYRADGNFLGDAMLYLGHRPSVDNVDYQVIEANILGFEGDLYDQDIRIEIIDFIRPDKKLDGLDALQIQIEADKIAIEKRLSTYAESS
jgi:riboflavin kinase / FMN adenylyltransferase